VVGEAGAGSLPLDSDQRVVALDMDRASNSYATAQEMAAKYRIGADTVRRRVQSGAWPCDRIGRLYRFSPAQQDEIAQMVR
jgi:hypothetical protein